MKTKSCFLICSLLITGVLLVFFVGCEEEENNGNETKTFTDPRDGNVYRYITIGDQIWMAENLRYLPGVVGYSTFSPTIPYYYVYGYNGTSTAEAIETSNYKTYGVLYNWPAALVSSPPGWHLPTNEEWEQLITFLGESDAGGKLKEKGTAHWIDPNFAATNETGFTALPGGYCFTGNSFADMGYSGNWWSATEANTSGSWYRGAGNNYSELIKLSNYKKLGFSVRCIKD